MFYNKNCGFTFSLACLSLSFFSLLPVKAESLRSPDSSTTSKACAVASKEKKGYVMSDCKGLSNSAQEQCAVASIEKKGYVMSDCKSLSNSAQEQCAVASIEKLSLIHI